MQMSTFLVFLSLELTTVGFLQQPETTVMEEVTVTGTESNAMCISMSPPGLSFNINCSTIADLPSTHSLQLPARQESHCGEGYISCHEVCCPSGTYCTATSKGKPACCPFGSACPGSAAAILPPPQSTEDLIILTTAPLPPNMVDSTSRLLRLFSEVRYRLAVVPTKTVPKWSGKSVAHSATDVRASTITPLSTAMTGAKGPVASTSGAKRVIRPLTIFRAPIVLVKHVKAVILPRHT